MKEIKGLGYYTVNKKNIVIVSDEYRGNPMVMWEYDILICSKEILSRFKSDLIAEHLIRRGWKPIVKLI